MSDMNEDLRYPVGKHVNPATIGEAERWAAIRTLAEMPARMQAALSGLDEAQVDTPYRPGGWTVRQLVHHVADSHGMALGRVKKALTEEWPVIFAYDEAAFAQLPDSLQAPVEWSLSSIESAHSRWVLLLESLTEEQWKRGFTHPERGRQTVEEATLLYQWHALHHVAHVAALRRREGW